MNTTPARSLLKQIKGLRKVAFFETGPKMSGPYPEDHNQRTATISWVIYDIGNTLFFVGVVGLFFPLWITTELGGDDATVGYTVAGAMCLNMLLAPLIGALSDQLPRRIPLLAIGTLTCAVATSLLGIGGMILSLVFFGLALTSIYIADVIYNTLLKDVSTASNRGFIGGLGVGTGYLGAILAVVVGLTLVDTQGYLLAFRTIAVAIIVVSVPLVVFLKESTRSKTNTAILEKAWDTWLQLRKSVKELPKSPGLLRFFVARFWYTWSLYTASAFAILYGTQTIGLSSRSVQLVLMVGLLVAVPSGICWGFLVDRYGPGRALKAAIVIWIFTLVLSLGIPILNLTPNLWWFVGVLSGIVVPGVWTADRPYLLSIASQEYLGESFGLRAMTSRLAAVAGPFSWGLVSVTLGLGQEAAIISLLACALISFCLLIGIRPNQSSP